LFAVVGDDLPNGAKASRFWDTPHQRKRLCISRRTPKVEVKRYKWLKDLSDF
jgi:hypothetical protein